MCGINGYIKNIGRREAEDLITQMNQAIIHRGPDDQGMLVQDEDDFMVAQGQVRLAIIDLSDAWFQPMFYDKYSGAFSTKHNPLIMEEIGNSSIRVVFNGEIYNYQEIKDFLIKKWYNFSSNSDTEVLLASYLQRGQDCVSRFNGMRSFALYDPRTQELFCSRDRLGKKPFYYYMDDNQFIFSSEIKGILEHKDLRINQKKNIDAEAIDFYFTTGYIPAPWSIYKNVRKLEARHNMIVKIKDWRLNMTNICYYEIPAYKPIYDKQKLIDEGKKLLEDSVKIRMFTSDVPVGAFLSGGLDSSSVVAEMTKRVDKDNLNTFSIWFEWKYDETKYINIVKDAFGTNHHHNYFREKNFEKILDDISFYYDEPFADYSNFPTLFVSELARKDVTVSLSGDGGDEIFGGYMMHQVAAQMSLIRKLPRAIRTFLSKYIPITKNNLSFLSKAKEACRVSLLSPEEFYANIGWSTLYKPEIYKQRTTEKMKELLEKTNGNFTQAAIDFDLFYNTLADNFLVKTDRASMAQPLEIRSPFLDIRRVDRSRMTPTKWKVNRRHTKILMRKIIEDIVPLEIINRKKQGFEPPLDRWILEYKHQDIIQQGMELLHTLRLDKREIFYQEKAREEKNKLYKIYQIRLFLFNKRYKTWIRNI